MSRDSSYKARLHLSVSRLTALGWPIFEARENKSPATKRGFRDAQVDSDQVLRWKPAAMAALATGSPGETVVVDLDVDSGKGLNGLDWLAQMEIEHGALPQHPIALTPRGGQHHYFKYPSDRLVRCSANKVAPGVDVRGTGGYVIVPDSESPKGAYRWEVAPWEVELPELPTWLLEKIGDLHPNVIADITEPPSDADIQEINRETEEILAGLRSAKTGGRNHALNIAAFLIGKMIGTGAVDETASKAQLLRIALEIGLTEAEAKATIRSGVSAGKKRPWRPLAAHRDLQRLNRDYFFALMARQLLYS